MGFVLCVSATGFRALFSMPQYGDTHAGISLAIIDQAATSSAVAYMMAIPAVTPLNVVQFSHG